MSEKKIRLSGIIDESITDGPGIRYVIFTQGCYHNCPGCHNPQTHDVNGGYLKDMDDLVQEINSLKYVKGVTFSGGEPFLQADKCHYIASKIDKRFDLISFSGFTFEELMLMKDKNKAIIEFLSDLDYLIDGRFVLEKRSLALKFRGSSNQRIIDVKKTLSTGEIVTKEF